MKKILVPIDGSKNSKLALEKARDLALLSNGEVMVVTVIKDLVSHLYALENEEKVEMRKVFLEQGEKTLKDALETFKDCPGKIDSMIVEGDPAQEIIRLAEEGEYDLVVMGSRGLDAFSRVMIGSISNKVLNHVRTSVLIVK